MLTSDQEDGNEVWSIVPWEKLDLAFGGPWVKKVRVSVCTSKVRVVFDLTPEAGLPYGIISGEDRLAVSFKPGPGFPTR
jgi:hypothetical protein